MSQFFDTKAETLQKFFGWTKRKIAHHFAETNGKEIFFREKEIWWAALGKNIGYEIDGKHELFERPVLVLRKYSSDMCFVLPFTTQIKKPEQWYQYVVVFGGIQSAINLTQGRSISSKRLLRRVGTLDANIYILIASKFAQQFYKK